jgi:hypothetical protein
MQRVSKIQNRPVPPGEGTHPTARLRRRTRQRLVHRPDRRPRAWRQRNRPRSRRWPRRRCYRCPCHRAVVACRSWNRARDPMAPCKEAGVVAWVRNSLTRPHPYHRGTPPLRLDGSDRSARRSRSRPPGSLHNRARLCTSRRCCRQDCLAEAVRSPVPRSPKPRSGTSTDTGSPSPTSTPRSLSPPCTGPVARSRHW